jgi:hypothetical protein
MKTSVLLPQAIKYQFELALAADGYGRQGGSRWIREAIISLVDHDPGMSTVGLGEDRQRFPALRTLELDEASSRALEKAVLIVRSQDPLIEGVRSAVIRAAIRHRLTRSDRSPIKSPGPR